MVDRIAAYIERVVRDRASWLPVIRQSFPSSLRRWASPEDVLSIAIERALRYGESADRIADDRLDGWFRTVIRRVVLDLKDEQQRAATALRSWADERRSDSQYDAYAPFLTCEEIIDRLADALDDLGEDDARLFLDVRFGDVPLDEVAERMGLTLSAVNSRYYRSKDRLEVRVVGDKRRKVRVVGEKRRNAKTRKEGRKEGRKENPALIRDIDSDSQRGSPARQAPDQVRRSGSFAPRL